MRLLFLDIDGVLCLDAHTFNKECMRNLNRIRKKTGALVIVTSAWRTMGNFAAIAQRHQLKYHDVTPDLGADDGLTHIRRHHEIQAYIKSNSGITSYCIIDDQQTAQLDPKRFVQCNYRFGLTPQLAESAIKILEEPI